MTQKKQGLAGRGAQKRTAPVKRYAEGDKVSKYPYTGQPAPTAQDVYGGVGMKGVADAVRPDSWNAARVTAPPGSVGGGLSSSGMEGSTAGGSIQNLGAAFAPPVNAAKAAVGAVGGVFADSAQAQREGTSYQEVRQRREASSMPQSNYTTSAQADRELGARQPPPPVAEQSYPNVGNAGDARFNADRGQLSFTDKNFDPTKQQFADGTGAITGRGGRTVLYTGMGVQGQQPGGQQGLSSAGPQAAGGWSNPYAAGTSEHNLFNYGGKNAVNALGAMRQGGAGSGTSDMAQQLAALSAQRMGAAQGGEGPSVMMLRSSAPQELSPYKPLGGGMTFGHVPAAQRHAEALMYNANVHAQIAADTNQTARRGQDLGMQSHLQGLDISGRYNLQNTGLQGQNQAYNTLLQGQSQLQNTGLQGQNQLQNTALQNMGAVGLESFKAGTPLAKANAAYSQAHAGYAGAQQRAIEVGLQNENIAQKQIRDIAEVIRQTPEGMNLSTEALWELARAQHEQNKPRGGHPDTAQAFDALKPTPEERQEFQRTGKLPARLAAAAAGQAQGYAEGGQVAPKETAEQVMARMAGKYGVAAPQQPAPQQPPAPPRPQQPPPQQGVPVPMMDTIRNRNEELRRITNYATGGPVGVGGRQVVDPSGRMDHTGSDSLPAVIDGDPAHPAALTSGEFVFPVEAVQHYGTDRLRKMVAAARKGGPLATGRQAA